MGVGIDEQIEAEETDGRLLAKPANAAAFLNAPLLVDSGISRDDLHGVEMVVDPKGEPISRLPALAYSPRKLSQTTGTVAPQA